MGDYLETDEVLIVEDRRLLEEALEHARKAYEFTHSAYAYDAMRLLMAVFERDARRKLAEADDFQRYRV